MKKLDLKEELRVFLGKIARKIFSEETFTKLLKIRIKLFGRPYIPGETSKAKERRIREDFFKKYAQGRGLDIGFGGDPITPNVKGYDFEHGDALSLQGLFPEETFDFVYSSHTLEHMPEPGLALKNWWKRVKTGGYLIIYLPHRDLFEQKKTLPSHWNAGHFNFYLPEKDDPPHTLGLRQLIKKNLERYKIVYLKICNEKYKSHKLKKPSEGEYSIEAVIKKI